MHSEDSGRLTPLWSPTADCLSSDSVCVNVCFTLCLLLISDCGNEADGSVISFIIIVVELKMTQMMISVES